MHAGGLVASAQTTASWVSELRPDAHQHWVTATAAPCTSLFKPVAVAQPVELGTPPTDIADNSLWWRHERFHRSVVRDPEHAFPLFERERNEIEEQWLQTPPDSVDAFAEHFRLLQRWEERLDGLALRECRPALVRRYWRRRNYRAKC
jgi:dipeptidase